ncbi:unnamed protein product [Discosporangium mesarthrocarpum]
MVWAATAHMGILCTLVALLLLTLSAEGLKSPMPPRRKGFIQSKGSNHRFRIREPDGRIGRRGTPVFPVSRDPDTKPKTKKPRSKISSNRKGNKGSQRIPSPIPDKRGDVGRVSGLVNLLTDGLSYLSKDDMREVERALAVSMYAHSVPSHSTTSTKRQRWDRHVKIGVQRCLVLGKLQLGTEALVAAILSDVLRPSFDLKNGQGGQQMGFGRARVTPAYIQKFFGTDVAKLVEKFEKATRLEEVAEEQRTAWTPAPSPNPSHGPSPSPPLDGEQVKQVVYFV